MLICRWRAAFLVCSLENGFARVNGSHGADVGLNLWNIRTSYPEYSLIRPSSHWNLLVVIIYDADRLKADAFKPESQPLTSLWDSRLL